MGLVGVIRPARLWPGAAARAGHQLASRARFFHAEWRGLDFLPDDPPVWLALTLAAARAVRPSARDTPRIGTPADREASYLLYAFFPRGGSFGLDTDGLAALFGARLSDRDVTGSRPPRSASAWYCLRGQTRHDARAVRAPVFLDGVGLATRPGDKPFAVARTPALDALAGGRRWLRDAPRHDNGRAVFVPTDPRLGVPGRPQSASGQATILTGRNIPAAIGEHYGPRPNPAIRALVRADNLFLRVTQAGGSAALINGYPPRFHEAISSGKRLPSAYQEAVLGAGLPIFTEVEMYAETP